MSDSSQETKEAILKKWKSIIGKQDKPIKDDRQIQNLKRQIKKLSHNCHLLEEELKTRQTTENVLFATKIRLRKLLNSSPAVIYSRQVTGNFGITFVSSSIMQFGYNAYDFLKDESSWKQYIYPLDLEKVSLDLSSLVNDLEQVKEYRILRKDGSFCWIQDQRKLLCDEFGNPIEIIGSWQNISLRKQVEQDLYQEKELAQTTLKSIAEAVITTDQNGYIEYLNPVAEQITGWQLHQCKGLYYSQVLNTYQEKKLELNLDQMNLVLHQGQTLSEECILIAHNQQKYSINRRFLLLPIKKIKSLER